MSYRRPSSGSMINWRFKGQMAWHFGYVTYEGNLTRMGCWNGDTMGGTLVDHNDIEWRERRHA